MFSILLSAALAVPPQVIYPEPPPQIVGFPAPGKPQEPPDPPRRGKSCLCSPACVCGCNEGRECQCQFASPAPAVRPPAYVPPPARFTPFFRPSFGPAARAGGNC